MRKTVLTLTFAALAGACGLVRADFYVVSHAGNAQASLSPKEAVDLYMGRTRTFANGDFALVFDLPREHPQRAAFYLALTGMSPAQLNSYWSRLMFSGQSMPPQALPNESAMVDVLKRNPNAVGWLSKEPTDRQLRTLLVIKDGN